VNLSRSETGLPITNSPTGIWTNFMPTLLVQVTAGLAGAPFRSELTCAQPVIAQANVAKAQTRPEAMNMNFSMVSEFARWL
jgi:hypothetical protein